jgi:hypothetical protein
LSEPASATENGAVSVSTVFFPGAGLDASFTDLVVVSADGVYFYVHTHRLLDASNNSFNQYLSYTNSSETIFLAEPSVILNLVFHSTYEIPCTPYTPSLSEFSAAMTALTAYGIPASVVLAPHATLSAVLLAMAPLYPLDVYTLAANHGAIELATVASVHLLSFQLPSLTDETAAQMGGVYVKKLFFLHLGRVEALKRELVTPPASHTPTMDCGWAEQKALTRAWALAAAYLSWEAKPGRFT